MPIVFDFGGLLSVSAQAVGRQCTDRRLAAAVDLYESRLGLWIMRDLMVTRVCASLSAGRELPVDFRGKGVYSSYTLYATNCLMVGGCIC